MTKLWILFFLSLPFLSWQPLFSANQAPQQRGHFTFQEDSDDEDSASQESQQRGRFTLEEDSDDEDNESFFNTLEIKTHYFLPSYAKVLASEIEKLPTLATEITISIQGRLYPTPEFYNNFARFLHALVEKKVTHVSIIIENIGASITQQEQNFNGYKSSTLDTAQIDNILTAEEITKIFNLFSKISLSLNIAFLLCNLAVFDGIEALTNLFAPFSISQPSTYPLPTNLNKCVALRQRRTYGHCEKKLIARLKRIDFLYSTLAPNVSDQELKSLLNDLKLFHSIK